MKHQLSYDHLKAAKPKYLPWVITYEAADQRGDVTRYVFGQEKTEAEARQVAAALRRAGRAGVRVERWVGGCR